MKSPQAFRTISEVSNEVNIPAHVLRFWETKFKQIKPKIINKRRYYNEDHVKTIKLIKFLIKDKGMTINGVKNVLKSKIGCS